MSRFKGPTNGACALVVIDRETLEAQELAHHWIRRTTLGSGLLTAALCRSPNEHVYIPEAVDSRPAQYWVCMGDAVYRTY